MHTRQELIDAASYLDHRKSGGIYTVALSHILKHADTKALLPKERGVIQVCFPGSSVVYHFKCHDEEVNQGDMVACICQGYDAPQIGRVVGLGRHPSWEGRPRRPIKKTATLVP